MLTKIFGSANDRYIKKLRKVVQKVNALEPEIEKLSDADLRAKTDEFKERLSKGETLDDLLVEAFAVVREAAKRTLHQRPYDVQIIGGIVLHNGQIAEMKTGEGKTLVSTLPVYLNALTGKGVHIVTVNDYLAKRDSEWMGQIYKFLGLSVGCVYQGLDIKAKQEAYACDVTYGTNSEMAFDYLRDNMALRQEFMVQRPFNYAIVDEVDSILIDEARTPLIISGEAEDSSERYKSVDKLMYKIKPEHYEKDEKRRQITLTDAGIDAVEELLREAGLMPVGSLYDAQNIALVHHVEQALLAHFMYSRDVDYIVRKDQVVIVDSFTGRIMDGRRYANGLHQALEAKENVPIQQESQTIAAITYQNYFRMFPKLAGMTGTAMTECGEFDSTYHLNVVEVPTNKPVIRVDEQDAIYGTAAEKYKAIIQEIVAAHEKGQPILVGTTSVEKSELLADMLQKQTKIRFEVLNAKNHEREAYIVAQAGAPGAVTIATNMAGRGTDIQLGGNLEMRLKEELEGVEDERQKEELKSKIEKEIVAGREAVLKAGGLYVIGTERHENRRIDNQLRGRSGRQGDPGRSIFFVSLEDDLMRIFGAERLKRLLKTFRIKEGERISHKFITSAIRTAQQKVEEYHYEIRKNVLQYDDVMNEQRKIIFEQRHEIMVADSIQDILDDMRHELTENVIYSFMPERTSPDEWDLDGLRSQLNHLLGIDFPVSEWIKDQKEPSAEALIELVEKESDTWMQEINKSIDPEIVHGVEKDIFLRMIDQAWKEHLQTLDFLRQSIWAHGKDRALNDYKKESFTFFENLLAKVRERTISMLTHMQLSLVPAEQENKTKDDKDIDFSNVGRNELCPCGSGKKFKHCHGKLA